jgi:hypothetical protein
MEGLRHTWNLWIERRGLKSLVLVQLLHFILRPTNSAFGSQISEHTPHICRRVSASSFITTSENVVMRILTTAEAFAGTYGKGKRSKNMINHCRCRYYWSDHHQCYFRRRFHPAASSHFRLAWLPSVPPMNLLQGQISRPRADVRLHLEQRRRRS